MKLKFFISYIATSNFLFSFAQNIDTTEFLLPQKSCNSKTAIYSCNNAIDTNMLLYIPAFLIEKKKFTEDFLQIIQIVNEIKAYPQCEEITYYQTKKEIILIKQIGKISNCYFIFNHNYFDCVNFPMRSEERYLDNVKIKYKKIEKTIRYNNLKDLILLYFYSKENNTIKIVGYDSMQNSVYFIQ